MQAAIADKYQGLDITTDTFPADNISSDPEAYLTAISSFQPGDAVTIFTPDDTHYVIALACIRRGLHVLGNCDKEDKK